MENNNKNNELNDFYYLTLVQPANFEVPGKFKDLAKKVRNEIYGRDVREAIAKSIEESGMNSAAAIKITEQLLDENFDEGVLATEIERRLNELEAEYAPELNNVKQGLDETNLQLDDHVDKNEIHRSILINEEPDPDPENYEEGQIVLAPLKEKGLIILDEVDLSGPVGYVNELKIPEKYQGKIKRFEIDIIGGVVNHNPRDVSGIIIYINDDTESNYRVNVLCWDTLNSEPAESQSTASTTHPRVGFLGQYSPGNMHASFIPTNIGETNSAAWISHGWANNGDGVASNYVWNGGGRWFGDRQPITHFTIRTPHHEDEWSSGTRAVLMGVL